MKLNQLGKALMITVLISMVAGIAAAQEDLPVETQDLEEEVENQTELSEEAANARLPGDRFYGLTTASERIELAVARAPFIGGPDREARTLANHADKRITEAEGLAARGDSQRAEQAANRYSEAMERASERAEASGNEETQQRIAEATSRHEQTLQRVSEQVPEEARQGIQTAIENSQRARDRAGGPPEDVGPGQAEGSQEVVPEDQETSNDTEQGESPNDQQEQGQDNAGDQGQSGSGFGSDTTQQ